MQPIDRGQSDEKNGNPNITRVNNDMPSSSVEKQEGVPVFKQNTLKDSDGLPTLKSFTMHGFKDSSSSPNPGASF